MVNFYRFILSLHIIAVISWMAGILYLIRLFVYHRAETEQIVKDRLEVMERRLFKVITLPASIAALIFGFWMIYLNPTIMSHGWMHAKLFFALVLFGLTHACGGIMRKLHKGTFKRSETFLRIFNEVPTLLMIIIVFLVILRPF